MSEPELTAAQVRALKMLRMGVGAHYALSNQTMTELRRHGLATTMMMPQSMPGGISHAWIITVAGRAYLAKMWE